MEGRKFIQFKKQEFGIKEYIKKDLGKGKISKLDIEYTPVGEKIIISTSKPGLIIGRKGEKIEELTRILKNRFKLENPHIEINEIQNPLFFKISRVLPRFTTLATGKKRYEPEDLFMTFSVTLAERSFGRMRPLAAKKAAVRMTAPRFPSRTGVSGRPATDTRPHSRR